MISIELAKTNPFNKQKIMNDLSKFDESKVNALLNDVEDNEETSANEETTKNEQANGITCLVVMPSGSAERVLAEMKKRAELDDTLAKGLEDKSKSIKGCVDYICNQMRKFANKRNSSLFVSDDEVFGLAVHYYTETNEMLGISKVTAKSKADKPKTDKPNVEKKADKIVALDPKNTKPTPKAKADKTLELSLF